MPTFNKCVVAIPEINFGQSKSGKTPVIRRIVVDVAETESQYQELTDKLMAPAKRILAIS